MQVKNAVTARYTEGANDVQPTLCCPVNYDDSLLKCLPQEIIDKDYGCGDPSRYVQSGDTVLDLGSGGGKICYMAAQLVGAKGHVIGIDMTNDMLALARQYQGEMKEVIGHDVVTFHKGHIQDLALDLDTQDRYLKDNPIKNSDDIDALNHWQNQQRLEHPMVPNNSVDLVISNCVLNLVSDEEKQQMINEIFRVLKPGGRVAISDIVSDEESPQALKQDEELWSGCISGAYQEEALVTAFTDAGFLGATLDKWDDAPWQIVEGIEFRSVTITAIKGDNRPCIDIGHAVIYKGPFASITDDEGHDFPRGARMAVCERSYEHLTSAPYQDLFIGIAPAAPKSPQPWCSPSGTRRPATETKGAQHNSGNKTGGCC